MTPAPRAAGTVEVTVRGFDGKFYLGRRGDARHRRAWGVPATGARPGAAGGDVHHGYSERLSAAKKIRRSAAVVTVGDIHGGTKRNIIADEVKLELTTRAFTAKSRQVILDGLRQTALGVATTAGLTGDKLPTVTVLEAESTACALQHAGPDCRGFARRWSRRWARPTCLTARRSWGQRTSACSRWTGLFRFAISAWVAAYPDRLAAAVGGRQGAAGAAHQPV